MPKVWTRLWILLSSKPSALLLKQVLKKRGAFLQLLPLPPLLQPLRPRPGPLGHPHTLLRQLHSLQSWHFCRH